MSCSTLEVRNVGWNWAIVWLETFFLFIFLIAEFVYPYEQTASHIEEYAHRLTVVLGNTLALD
ncbi:MAG: hypothetical protein F6K10_33735 [Moorea sp. SIO2B7]|nr:hypothetical protein [Moorena sp. SIO2B7]